MGIIEYVSNQFSKPSGLGGVISTFIMNKMNRKQYESVIKNIKVNNGDKVLDIGFGNGKLIMELSLKTKGKFYGIDVSEDMIVKGKKKYPMLDLRWGNILESPFENDFFNSIYTINTIYFWKDINKGLSEVKRNLKKDGVFINVFYTKEWLEGIRYTSYGFNKYTLDELKEKTEESGFSILEVIEISKNKSYCIIASKRD
jgi:ubiquinone/menaquinone biosynthesis C-methylase UbiE